MTRAQEWLRIGMRQPRLRLVAGAVLLAIFATSLLAGWIAPAPYAQQFRDSVNAAPSPQHLLGTDAIGRDRLSRLLYGTRVSLILAPLAALLATLLAAVIGGAAGYLGGHSERLLLSATDLFLCVPLMFLLISARALLPLNVAPAISVVVTFALLGALGWAPAARVICAAARDVRTSDYTLQSRAWGCGGTRLLLRQVLPNVRGILLVQFWVSIPAFILAESTLGMLGLGVTEPLPSWGGLLRELEDYSLLSRQPWVLVPLLVLIVVVASFQAITMQFGEGTSPSGLRYRLLIPRRSDQREHFRKKRLSRLPSKEFAP